MSERFADVHDPLYPVSAQFPTGRPFGLLPASDEMRPSEILPFGLHLAVVSQTVPIGDIGRYGYDHDQQIGTVRDGGQVLPLLKHTTGQTNTVTHPDGKQGPDSDTDYRED